MASAIAGLDAAAGKADLPGVVAQGVGAAREQHLPAVRSRATRPTSTAASRNGHVAAAGRRVRRGSSRGRRAARPADAAPRAGASSVANAIGGVMSPAMRLAQRQHDFHQPQALVVAHLRPARDFGGGAAAALAQAGVVEAADADAGTEDGAEGGVMHWNQAMASRSTLRNERRRGAGVRCYVRIGLALRAMPCIT